MTTLTSGRILEGRTVIVTGAASGVGAATARRASAEGAAVVLVDLNGPLLDSVVGELAQAGGEFAKVIADVTDDAACHGIVETAIALTGRLDGLVNNAGVLGTSADLSLRTEDDFDRMVDVNLKATWLMFRAAREALVLNRGSIVNTVSYAASHASTGFGFYGMTKAGLRSLTQTAAVELARYGVRVNAVAPGPIDTPMIRDLEGQLDPADHDSGSRKILRPVPMRRYGKPEEIASAIVFLLGPDASFITGTVLAVDGGMSAV